MTTQELTTQQIYQKVLKKVPGSAVAFAGGFSIRNYLIIDNQGFWQWSHRNKDELIDHKMAELWIIGHWISLLPLDVHLFKTTKDDKKVWACGKAFGETEIEALSNFFLS